MKWIIAVFIAGAITCQAANTYYVATNGLDTRTGLNYWTNAVLTISNAVAKATTAGDTILVSNGTYVVTTNIYITSNITVRSWNSGNLDRTNTIINGNWPLSTNRCLYLNHTSAVFAGFSLTNGCAYSAGVAESNGGGIYLYMGTVSNCIIAFNRSYALYEGGSDYGGGGIITPGGTTIAWIYDCDIYGNITSNYGGGILFVGGQVVMANCSIHENLAVRGGGISSYSGGTVSSISISNCTITSNTAVRYGGGLQFVYNTRVYNSAIQYNHAISNGGGGVYVTDNSSFYSCPIANNRTESSGGGVLATIRENCTGLYNCAISSNQAKNFGGIYIQGQATYPDFWSVYNTVIWGNTSTGVDYPNDSNLYVNAISTGLFYNCCLGGTNFTGRAWSFVTNCIAKDPQMIDLPGGNYRLARGSPCINTGLNQEWMTNSFDRDGHARIDHFRRQVDMGAYEYLSHGTVLSGH